MFEKQQKISSQEGPRTRVGKTRAPTFPLSPMGESRRLVSGGVGCVGHAVRTQCSWLWSAVQGSEARAT